MGNVTTGLKRGLLPTLFAIIALMLFMHQPIANEYAPNSSLVDCHAEVQVHQDAHHPVHSSGCCTSMAGIAVPDFGTVFYGGDLPGFAPHAVYAGGYLQFRSKHFRPPRES